MLRIGGKEFVIYHVNRTQSREPGKKILLILISWPIALSVHVGKIRAVSSIPYLSMFHPIFKYLLGIQGLQELDVWQLVRPTVL